MPYLLQLQVEGFETDDRRDELLLVSLDSLDGDDALCHLIRMLCLGSLCLCSLFLCVLCGAFLGLDGEGCGRRF
jgi:hypothetical protein